MQVHSEILATYDYYPFGLTFDDPIQQVAQPKNLYLYNGKEFQEETEWYDFGARMYDPVIGRFPSVDPIIERFPYLTPYNYASNSPVTNIDLWGLQGTNANTIWGKVVKNVKAVGEGFSQLPDAITDDATAVAANIREGWASIRKELANLEKKMMGDGENWYIGIIITSDDPDKLNNDKTGFTADKTLEVKNEDIENVSLVVGAMDKKPANRPQSNSQRTDSNNAELTQTRRRGQSSKETFNSRAREIMMNQNDGPESSSYEKPNVPDSMWIYIDFGNGIIDSSYVPNTAF